MGRPATGTVDWKGNPPRPFARVQVGIDPVTKEPIRKWRDLERPDLREDVPADVALAKKLACKLAKMAKKKKLRAAPGRDAPAGTTPADLQDDWFGHLDTIPSLSDPTRAHLKAGFRSQFIVDCGQVPLGDFYGDRGAPILCRWIRRLTTKTSPRTGRLLGKGYIDHVIMAPTRFFDDARLLEWAPAGKPNPMRSEDVRRTLKEFSGGRASTPHPSEITFLEIPAVEQLLTATVERPLAALHPDFWFGKELVGFTGGERDAEIHGATFEHARIRERQESVVPYLRVRQQVILPTQGKPAHVSRDRDGYPTLKTRYSRRDIPLHPLAVEWLSWWEDEGWQAYVGRKPKPSDFIFPDRHGNPYRPDSAHVLRALLLNAGLSDRFVTPDGKEIDFEWKTTRSTFARWLSDAGVSAEIAEALLGHAPTTMRGLHYSAPSLELKAKAIAKIVLKVRPPFGRKGRAA